MGFSRQEYWSGLPCPPPGDLSKLGTEPVSYLLHWRVGSLPLAPPGKPEFLLRPSKEMTVTRVLYDMKLIKQKDKKQSDRKCEQEQNRGKCRNAFILFYAQ